MQEKPDTSEATASELQELQQRLESRYGKAAERKKLLVVDNGGSLVVPDEAKDPRQRVYQYEGVRGRIRVDGVEVDLDTLTEQERITAGEQLLKQIAEQEGKSVKQVRDDITAISVNVQASKGKPPARLALVKTAHGNRPMLTHSGMNRKQRRAARSRS